MPIYATGPRAELVSGQMDNTELFSLVSDGVSTPGDADWDSDVDFADCIQLLRRYGQEVTRLSSGDFDGDGRVGPADLETLRAQLEPSAATEVIPEPSVMFLFSAGLLAAGRRR